MGSNPTFQFFLEKSVVLGVVVLTSLTTHASGEYHKVSQHVHIPVLRIDERLGSGEFGDVVKGYWKSADYSVEVALKTLSGGQGQEGRRKLLQEAAIMSQFRHPNVVKLYGVVNDDNDKVRCSPH